MSNDDRNEDQELLAGLKVVDFTSAAAGPFCTMMLGDLGAEVIKVEPPIGDHGRQWGNWHVDQKSFLFLAVNRNKRSVVLDLREEVARKKALRLIADADVVVESFAPGGAEKLGVDYETCRNANPKVVYLSVSGFGRTGPRANELGMDMMLQAYTGIMSYTGEPGRPPVRIAVSAIDMMTGALGFGAVLAALRDRDKTGKGQHVEVSLYDSAMSMLLWAIPQYSKLKKNPVKLGGEFEHVYPYGNFEAKDGYFYLGVATPAAWERFCKHMGLDDLRDDPRFRTNADRLNHRDELREILVPLFKERTLAELVGPLKESGVLAAEIREVGDAVYDEHAYAREAVVPLKRYPEILVGGLPIKLERGVKHDWEDPPDLGSHTDSYFSAIEDQARDLG